MNRIDLGRVGEYGARSVVFDLSEFSKYGEGEFVLLHKRANDFAPYIVNTISVDGNKLTWNIGSDDTACLGTGMAEIQLHSGETLLAKSDTYHTFVDESLGASAPPETYEQITIDTVAAYAADAHTSAVSAEASRQAAEIAATFVVHPPQIGSNGNWFIWDGSGYSDSGMSSKGAKGDIGPGGPPGPYGNGILSISKTSPLGLVDTYTILFDNGITTTYTVTNGAKGDKGDTGDAGRGIVSIQKTASQGLVDVYTITYTDETTDSYYIVNGAPAGFGTLSATADNNVGTPSVEVSTSGPATALNIAFAFHNIKGNTGEKGDTGDEGKMLDKNTGNELFGWIGTMDEYNALSELEENTWYWIKEPT